MPPVISILQRLIRIFTLAAICRGSQHMLYLAEMLLVFSAPRRALHGDSADDDIAHHLFVQRRYYDLKEPGMREACVLCRR